MSEEDTIYMELFLRRPVEVSYYFCFNFYMTNSTQL